MLIRRRAAALPEESAALRGAVFAAVAVAAGALGLFAGLAPLALLCLAVAALGHRWSWRHRGSNCSRPRRSWCGWTAACRY